MKRLLAAAVIALTMPTCLALPAAAQEAEWLQTGVTDGFWGQIEQEFNQCRTDAINAGASPTNELFLNCLPSGDEAGNVLAGRQAVTSGTACFDWSVSAMAGIISDEMMSQLNANTDGAAKS